MNSSGLRITGLWATEGTSTSDALQNVLLSGPISIGYRKETHYDSVVLEIRNADGVLVYSDDVTGTAEESQQTAVWEMRWNRPPYAGDVCNPAHNPYSIKLIGTTDDRKAESNEATVVKFLEISCDLDDSPDEPGGYASGLYPPMLGIGGDASERLQIGIVPESDDGTHAIWPGSDYPTEFSNLVKDDAHGASAAQNTEDQTIYKASVRQKMLGMASPIPQENCKVVFWGICGGICHPDRSEGSRWQAGICTMPRRFFAALRMTDSRTLQFSWPIPDGAYHVIMKNERDVAGNDHSSTNGINLKWTFRLH